MLRFIIQKKRRKRMSFKIKYLLVVYVTIIALFLLTGCSEFETLMEEKQNQLTCSPSYETLCAGWEV